MSIVELGWPSLSRCYVFSPFSSSVARGHKRSCKPQTTTYNSDHIGGLASAAFPVADAIFPLGLVRLAVAAGVDGDVAGVAGEEWRGAIGAEQRREVEGRGGRRVESVVEGEAEFRDQRPRPRRKR